jgi:NAD(P)-dependent dehydrogenase (short-subunit alcohol dehydrogenase family)
MGTSDRQSRTEKDRMTIPELQPRSGSFASYPTLKDRVVLVTGGGSGIGASIVAAFAGQGAKVAFIDVDAHASEKLVKSIGGARPPLFVHCDLTDIDALRAAISRVRNEIGPIGVLVNNAANDTRQAIDEVTPESWDRAMNVNLKHQFFAAQAVHPHMRELRQGSIINFSSTAWMFGGADFVAYSTAKAAVVGLTNALARKFGPDDIRVNAIAPGAVHTERQLRLWYSKETANDFVKRQLLHHWLLADELARTTLFLAADDSRMITKQLLIVDGGLR